MNKPESPAWRKWREVIGRQRASGMSVSAFCRHSGVAASSLFAWKRRLASARATPVFIEAKVSGEAGAAESPGVAKGVIEVRLHRGRRVRVSGAGFDRNLLAEVVATLEALP